VVLVVILTSEWQLVLVGMEKAEAFIHGTEVIHRGEIINKVYYVETGELALDGINELGEVLYCQNFKESVDWIRVAFDKPKSVQVTCLG